MITLTEPLPFKLTQSQFNNITKVIQSYNQEFIENEEHKRKKQHDHKVMQDSKHLTSSKEFSKTPIKITKYKPQAGQQCNATIHEPVEILDWNHANGESQTKTVKHFTKTITHLTITQPLVRKWVKDGASIQAKLPTCAPDIIGVRAVAYQKIDLLVISWIDSAEKIGLVVNSDDIQNKWKHFARLEGLTSKDWLKLQGGWLNSFKN